MITGSRHCTDCLTQLSGGLILTHATFIKSQAGSSPAVTAIA